MATSLSQLRAAKLATDVTPVPPKDSALVATTSEESPEVDLLVATIPAPEPAPAQVDRKGQYRALRQRRIILSNGASFVPDSDGYFAADTKEKKQILEYYDSLNRGLVEFVE